MSTNSVLLDDRLLVSVLVGAPVSLPPRRSRRTTTYWYYRACRAAMAGGGGKLAGPFAALDESRQAEAIRAMLALPSEIGLPDPRELVPVMTDVHGRHSQLNLLNLEAVAAAKLLRARVLLSPPAAAGVLPAVLDAEEIEWREIDPA